MLPSSALLLATLLAGPAQARVGVTVRLTEPEDGLETAEVLLAAPGQDAQGVSLADDGQPPDTVAGDGTWTGTAFVEDGELSVGLKLGDSVLQGGTVSWTADIAYRDLLLRIEGDALVAEAAGAGAPGEYIGGASTPATGADAFGAAGAASARKTTPAQAASVASGDSLGAGVLLVGAGGLLLFGLALGWALLPSLREGDGGAIYERLPEPPLFGPGSPSLSDGLTVWVTPPDQHDALARLLCRTLSTDHRVLLAAPPSLVLPPQPGGRVYLAHGRSPDDVGDAAEHLDDQGGPPLAVVVTTTTESLARRFPRELPPGVGGVLIVGADINTALPVYRCAASDDGGWTLQGPGGTLTLVQQDGLLAAG